MKIGLPQPHKSYEAIMLLPIPQQRLAQRLVCRSTSTTTMFGAWAALLRFR
jgi:hypothetical protein